MENGNCIVRWNVLYFWRWYVVEHGVQWWRTALVWQARLPPCRARNAGHAHATIASDFFDNSLSSSTLLVKNCNDLQSVGIWYEYFIIRLTSHTLKINQGDTIILHTPNSGEHNNSTETIHQHVNKVKCLRSLISITPNRSTTNRPSEMNEITTAAGHVVYCTEKER